jgi:hypothetical protein
LKDPDQVVNEKADKANKLLAELASLFPKVDEKTQKIIKNQTSGLSLEHEFNGELRIFCVFNDTKTGKYRVTQGDTCFVDNLVNKVSFSEAISSMIVAGIKAGEKISLTDIDKVL